MPEKRENERKCYENQIILHILAPFDKVDNNRVLRGHGVCMGVCVMCAIMSAC